MLSTTSNPEKETSGKDINREVEEGAEQMTDRRKELKHNRRDLKQPIIN
jgi:hypothetical protein